MSDITYSKMPCTHCKGQISFPSKDEGEVTKCPHCQAYIRLKSSVTNPDKVDGFLLMSACVGVLLILVGIGMAVCYFLFYSVTNPGSVVVNSARLHTSLCGVIIGIGLSLIGTLSIGYVFVLLLTKEIISVLKQQNNKG